MPDPTDISGTCTLGGTAQNIAAAKSGRTSFTFCNISDTVMYLNFGATATADKLPVAANGGFVSFHPPDDVPDGAISMLCATTGKKFYATES